MIEYLVVFLLVIISSDSSKSRYRLILFSEIPSFLENAPRPKTSWPLFTEIKDPLNIVFFGFQFAPSNRPIQNFNASGSAQIQCLCTERFSVMKPSPKSLILIEKSALETTHPKFDLCYFFTCSQKFLCIFKDFFSLLLSREPF